MRNIIVLMCVIGFVSSAQAAERHELDSFEAIWNTQTQLMGMPETRAGTLSTPDVLWSQAPSQRQPLSSFDAMWNTQVSLMEQPVMSPEQTGNYYQYPASQYQLVRYVAAYAPPMYYAAPYPQQQYVQNVAAWLFGAPRQPSVPMDVTEAHSEQAEPTPQPVATVAAESAIIRPATIQAGIIAAPVIAPQTRQVEECDPTISAIPEMTLLDMLNYWTRKILLTGVLLSIGAFAWYKEHTARHQASRRLADLEQDMQRLDRLIYGNDRKGGDTP